VVKCNYITPGRSFKSGIHKIKGEDKVIELLKDKNFDPYDPECHKMIPLAQPKTHKEIAMIAGVSVNTVQRIISKYRKSKPL